MERARRGIHLVVNTGDENEDGRLSLEEVLHNIHVFFGSKFVKTAPNFHDEFGSARVDVAAKDAWTGSWKSERNQYYNLLKCTSLRVLCTSKLMERFN